MCGRRLGIISSRLRICGGRINIFIEKLYIKSKAVFVELKILRLWMETVYR